MDLRKDRRPRTSVSGSINDTDLARTWRWCRLGEDRASHSSPRSHAPFHSMRQSLFSGHDGIDEVVLVRVRTCSALAKGSHAEPFMFRRESHVDDARRAGA
eukprot:1393338-Pleurochrysis_carterae.AAC.1